MNTGFKIPVLLAVILLISLPGLRAQQVAGEDFGPRLGPFDEKDPPPPWTTEGYSFVCFSQGTDADYVGEVNGRMEFVNAQLDNELRYFLLSRWPGNQGAPITLTWSIVPDGLIIPNLIGEGSNPSEMFSRMDSLFTGQGGRSRWILRIQQCFDRWAELSGITFVRRTSGGNDWDDGAAWGASGSGSRGDIRLTMKPIDGGNGILGFTASPTNGDMVLDRQESWGSSTNLHRFLRDVVTHELGHSIGIAHVCSDNRKFLMEPFIDTSFDGPRLDDVRAAQRWYGDIHEADNSSGGATSIGTLTVGGSINDVCLAPAPLTGSNSGNVTVCSIDANGEQDFFSFDLMGAALVSATVNPRGATYDDNAQNANGSCPAGNDTNSLAFANLNIQMIDSDGSTVLASGFSNGKGLSETVDVNLAAGTYFVRIFEGGGGPSQTQLYGFTLTASAGCPDADGDGVCDPNDGCPNDPGKIDPGVCGCGVPDTDSDGDGVPDCVDICPGGNDNVDTDGDGTPDFCDGCPNDSNKTDPGVCGCGVPETVGDSDGDGDVDLTDLANVLGDFGSSGAGLAGDVDNDLDVDLTDLALVLGNFGQSCPP